MNKRKSSSGPYVGQRVAKRRKFKRSSALIRVPYEKKFFTTTFVDTSIDALGVIFPSMNIIAQDDLPNGRTGRKITIQSIDGRFTSRMGTNPAVNPSGRACGRIIVYVDKQCNGAAATVAQILESQDFDSFYNLENVDRFDILYDKFDPLEVTTYNSDSMLWSGGMRFHKFHKKLNLPILYDTTVATGAITSQKSNNIGVLVIASDDEAYAIEATIRVRYSDL